MSERKAIHKGKLNIGGLKDLEEYRNSDEHFTLLQLAEMYEGVISIESIRKWAELELFPIYRITPRKILVKPREFKEFLDNRRKGPSVNDTIRVLRHSND